MRQGLYIERATKRVVEAIDVLLPYHLPKGDTGTMYAHWKPFRMWLLQPLPLLNRPRRRASKKGKTNRADR